MSGTKQVDGYEQKRIREDEWTYVLLVIDFFSRFLWLRPLESKSSQVIAVELKCNYMECGSPEIIQCDQGGEFKNALKLLRDRMNIKLIYSRPCHNQSQGKVERYYRALRSKMEYDLRKIGQDGVERAKQLPRYPRILNNDPKEVIAYKTPFEIYFALNCNAFRESRFQDEILPSAGRARPTKNDRYRRSRQALKLRNWAKKATSRCDKRMQRKQLRLNPPLVYNSGEKVYIRLRGKPSNKQHVTEGRIEKRKIKLYTYKVSYTSPLSGKEERKWVSVNDITSLTLERETETKMRQAV